jgi:hypothetical protein
MTGSEALIAQAISGIAVPVFQTLWGQGGKVLGLFGKTLDEKAKQAIFKASRQYAQNYTERHGILKVLGMREPVSLESVYTTVQFLDDAAIQSFESVETLELIYRKAKQRSFQSKDCPKQPGITVANQKQYLMVLGSPGAGKSTFLRRMGLEVLKGKKGQFKHACIPVLIELKTFNQGEIEIEHKIAEEFRICGFPTHQEFTAKALEQGKLLILLDGLDEVPTERMNQVIQHIQNVVDLHKKNRFIASCRVAAYRHNFRRFTDVAMAEFDDAQIENFISNWFGREPEIGQECWQKLNHEDNKAAKELTQTPLLLTLVCLLYQRSRKFPTNRATLYERALRVLLEEWAAEKGVFKDDVYKGLDTKRKEMMLSEIAHDAFQADHLFLPRREIADQIEELLAEMLPDETLIHGEAVLRSIEVQHGVLVERAEGVYSFSHLTLQEYLTAQYIDDHRQIDKLVTEHLSDERWQEVFLLVSGLMRGGADELLLLMEKEAQTYINTPRLQALLRWTDWVTADSESNINPVAKRAIAYVIANTLANAITLDYANYLHLNIYARAIARTLGFSRNLANADDFVSTLNLSYVRDRAVSLKIAKNLTRDLEKIKIFKNIDFTLMIARIESLKTKLPDSNQPYKVHKEFANKLLHIWLKAFNLKKYIIQLSVKETSAFHNYFYVNYLIIQCKKSAVRVSPKTWAEIEERMLRVPNNG